MKQTRAFLLYLALGIVASVHSVLAQTAALPPGTYKQLTEIHKLIEDERFSDALSATKALRSSLDGSNYENAVVLQTEGYIYANLADYKNAITAFNGALQLNRLPAATQQQLRFQLAQLYLAQEQPEQALLQINRWIDESAQPWAEASALQGTALAQLKRYREAIPAFEKAVAMEPRETWRQTLLALNYELQRYKACATILRSLIKNFPGKADYWKQLASMYILQEDHANALVTLELAERQGYLSEESDRLQLVQLYLQRGIPYKAATLLEDDLKSGRIRSTSENRELLASAWTLTRHHDHAIIAWKAAAKHADNGAPYRQLGYLYYETGDWGKAADALEKAISRGLKNHQADAWLMLGICHYESGKRDAARNAFTRAAALDSGDHAAQQWLKYLESS